MYQYILFDLDGTLADTSEGILNSAQYSLKQCGIAEADRNKLKKFIGPPLKDTFMKLYSMDEEQATEATAKFREFYNEHGKYQCKLYNGTEHLLKSLKEHGATLIVATSKPTVFSEEILSFLKIDQYFDGIIGSNLDNTRSKKGEIIGYILQEYNISDKKSAVMIGDKSQDLTGAFQCGISAIGVTYGFGTLEELSSVTSEAILNSPSSILTYLERT